VGKTIAMWMTAILTINMMFAPLLGYFNSLLREGVEVTLMEGAKKASIQGRWDSPIDIKADMITTLQTKYNINMSDAANNYVTITSGGGVNLGRGQALKASITIKESPLFVFNIFKLTDGHYTKSVSIMSEYTQ
jgi:hypothetical protein